MLVLSRRLNEAIVIGNGIRVCIVEITGQTVRLGIEAPPDVNIVRGELKQKAVSGSKAEPAGEYRTDCCVC